MIPVTKRKKYWPLAVCKEAARKQPLAGSFIKGSDWMHDAIHCFNLIVIPSLTGHYHRLTISLSSIISMELHIDAFFIIIQKKI